MKLLSIVDTWLILAAASSMTAFSAGGTESVALGHSSVSRSATFNGSASEFLSLNISCPPGFIVDGKDCICASDDGFPFRGVTECEVCGRNSTLVLIWLATCVTLDGQNMSRVVGGSCFSSLSDPSLYNPVLELPENEMLQDLLCAPNRRAGTLCGQCDSNSTIDMNSLGLKCMPKSQCHSYSWILFVLEVTIPSTILFILIAIFQPNLTSPHWIISIFACQFLALRVSILIINAGLYHAFSNSEVTRWLTNAIGSTYGILNLDFMRYALPPLCFTDETNTFQALALDYMAAFYPLLLILLMYIAIELYSRNVRIIVWMWRPIGMCFVRFRHHVNPQASTVYVFAIFLVLSYNKLIQTSMYFYITVSIFSAEGDSIRFVMFYDGSVDLFGANHLPYVILGTVVMLLFVIFPAILLLVYQLRCVQRCLEACRLRRHGLVAFVEIFQGHFKDGLNGDRDYRFFAGIYFLGNFIVATALYLHFVFVAFLVFQSISAAFVIMKPYKNEALNKLVTLQYQYLSLLTATILQLGLTLYLRSGFQKQVFTMTFVFFYIVILVPALYIALRVLLLCRRKLKSSLMVGQQHDEPEDLPPLRNQDTEDDGSIADRVISPQDHYQFSLRMNTDGVTIRPIQRYEGVASDEV